MIFRIGTAAVLSSVLLPVSHANTPPPMTFEEEICTATHVFVGTAKSVRFVNASHVKMCRDEPATYGGALTSCGSAEVDVTVTEVLFPSTWKHEQRVVYRFGGGLFSTESLKADLEGQTYIFHAIPDPDGGNTFVTSAPWVLGKSPKEKKRVNSVLAKCLRR